MFVGKDQEDLARVICTRLFLVVKGKGRFTRLQERSVGSSKGKGYSFVKKEDKRGVVFNVN